MDDADLICFSIDDKWSTALNFNIVLLHETQRAARPDHLMWRVQLP